MATILFGNRVDGLNPTREKECKALCTNYRDLQVHIMAMDEQQLLQCIVVERANRKRANILNRLYSRFSELRKNRERLELTQ